jgi:hypothetical protein
MGNMLFCDGWEDSMRIIYCYSEWFNEGVLFSSYQSIKRKQYNGKDSMDSVNSGDRMQSNVW